MSSRGHDRGGGGYQNQGPAFPNVPQKDLEAIIKGDDVESAKLTVEWGEKVGEASKDSATSSQLRIIFTAVRFIEAQWPAKATKTEADQALRQFILLKSKLRYQAVRQSKLKDIVDLFTRCIDLVNDRDTFLRFVDFFEAILAYHKTGSKG